MGNSLLDIMVYGRIAGVSAAKYVKGDSKDGKLTLEHVDKYNKEIEDSGKLGDELEKKMLEGIGEFEKTFSPE